MPIFFLGTPRHLAPRGEVSGVGRGVIETVLALLSSSRNAKSLVIRGDLQLEPNKLAPLHSPAFLQRPREPPPRGPPRTPGVSQPPVPSLLSSHPPPSPGCFGACVLILR